MIINTSNLTAGSWKTTSAGLLTIISALTHLYFAHKTAPLTEKDMGAAASLVFVGVGLIFARDNNKTSTDVGAVTTRNVAAAPTVLTGTPTK